MCLGVWAVNCSNFFFFQSTLQAIFTLVDTPVVTDLTTRNREYVPSWPPYGYMSSHGPGIRLLSFPVLRVDLGFF